MQIHISPRHVRLTAALHAYVAEKIGHLEHYTDKIIGAHIAIWQDDSKTRHTFVIKVHLAMPGPDIYGEDRGHDLYQAIDLVTDRLSTQLRGRKDKVTRGRRRVARKAKQKRQTAAA